MKRKQALELIRHAATFWQHQTYLNPNLSPYLFLIGTKLIDEKFVDLICPDDCIDRMTYLASFVKRMVEKSPFELVNVPTHGDSLMGQLEFFLSGIPVFVIFLNDSFWVGEEEWFPFD